MADLIKFTKNYDDLSTDKGYQFKFYCDICGNGYLSPFENSKMGVASGILRGIGGLTGGILGRVGEATYDIQRTVGGKAHDEALKRAVEAVKPHFMQCSRCGKWVCKEVCWNTERGLCVECAPKLEQEMAAAQTEATISQMKEKVFKTDYTKDLNVVGKVVAKCPKCGAETKGAKFCPNCGAKLVAEYQCQKCGAKLTDDMKFCPECGRKNPNFKG